MECIFQCQGFLITSHAFFRGGVVTERKALGACESRFRSRFNDENLHAPVDDQSDFLGVLKND